LNCGHLGDYTNPAVFPEEHVRPRASGQLATPEFEGNHDAAED
jgi:hypothetical protein